MTDIDTIALQAWKDGIGDAMTAVKLVRERTDFNMWQALEVVQKTAALVGGRCNLRIVSSNELPPEIAEQLAGERRERHEQLAAHRAARGVRKVRGSK
jgi:hypothetical protein